MKTNLLFIFCTLIFWACDQQQPRQAKEESTRVTYARGFQIMEEGTLIKLKIFSKSAKSGDAKTYLLRRGKAQNPQEISIPIQSIVCTSTTHLPLLELLSEEKSLLGFPGTKYISSEVFNQRVAQGQIKDLGTDNQLNIESIVDLAPDLTMAFTMGGESQQLRKLEAMGVSVVFNGDYLEETILGRAEWIKVMAAFFDKLELADSIFNGIASSYSQLQNKAAQSTTRPTVMSGIMYGDAWYMPGGKNWGSTMIAHAGGKYIWEENTSSGWIEAGFESVLDKAEKADYWIGLASIRSLEDLKATDDRYGYFSPFKNQQVYNYTAKIGPGGGFAIMESGYAQPQIVLADLIKILHPELLPDHTLYYYEQLR